jgi:hypothetical protein
MLIALEVEFARNLAPHPADVIKSHENPRDSDPRVMTVFAAQGAASLIIKLQKQFSDTGLTGESLVRRST